MEAGIGVNSIEMKTKHSCQSGIKKIKSPSPRRLLPIPSRSIQSRFQYIKVHWCAKFLIWPSQSVLGIDNRVASTSQV